MENKEEIEEGKIVVLMEDESHLLWGDCLGYVWGKRNEQIEVDIVNKKEKQTYYGAINILTKDFHFMQFDTGNGKNTVEFIKYLQSLYEGKKLWIRRCQINCVSKNCYLTNKGTLESKMIAN